MKNLLLVSYVLLLASVTFAQVDYTQYVNPFIGTGGHGHTFPGATVPFGMVQLSPDTRDDGSWDGCGGYHYSDSLMFGFSHTHLSGTGCSDYGDILLMPVLDSVDIKKKYSARFHHKNEKASPGYYSVKFDNGIFAELAAAQRAGIHRYTFPPDSRPGLIIDLMHRDKVIDASMKLISDKVIEGYRISEAWAKEQHVYFRIEFSVPYKLLESKMDTLRMNSAGTEIQELKGNIRVWLKFNMPPGVPLQIKVSISGVDEAGARLNLQTSMPHWYFEKYKSDATAAWNKELGKIEVSGGKEEQMKNFYTALYHCMLQPNIYSDADHRYRGRDNKIHIASGFDYYTVFSLWDTFRAWHPLMTIIDRKRTLDYIKTFLAQYEQGGLLPVWELSSNETECMIGYHSVSVIADAAAKGITNFDLEEALEAMKKSAESAGRFGLGAYMAKGFLEADDEHESVSKTLEYCYDDWCIAQLAKHLHHQKDYNYFMLRSQGWKNLFDPQKKFIRPRKNGGWYEPFDPREVNNNYTEANAWQYNFFVPHDVGGLIKLNGGSDVFDIRLDELFASASETTGREQSDITGLIGQYAHGNEPSHHMAFLYNYIYKPWKTEQIVHKILMEFYKNSPDGLIGNEDCGQMSAWYVLASMGLYQVVPGNPEFVLSAPLFPEIKIHTEGGKTFYVRTENIIEKNIYVDKRKLNGKFYDKLFLPYSGIISGDTLAVNLSSKPDYSRFIVPDSADKILNAAPDLIVPAPVIVADKNVFRDTMTVEIKSLSAYKKLFYSTDTVEAGKKWKVEINNSPSKPNIQPGLKLKIDTTTTLKAFIENEKGIRSRIVTAEFFRMPHPGWKVSLISKYSPQYTAGGDEGLIDGLRGTTDWRKGYWQGYQSQDFECVIDLGAEKEITKLSAGLLQDVGAWIMFPKKVEFEISVDGKKFSKAATIENKTPDKDLKVQAKDFSKVIVKQKTRYIKVKAKNYGKLPSWHAGAGGDAWIFLDEIIVE